MRRGEIWTVSGGPDYSGKPRPAVIVQEDSFAGTQSITICSFTTSAVDMPFIRLVVEPTLANGLRSTSRVMIDKITTVPRSKLGQLTGVLSTNDMLRVGRAVAAFLGVARVS